MSLPLDSLTATHFDPHVGTEFSIRPDGAGDVALELIAVRRLGHGVPGASRAPFALDFRGRTGLRLDQGTYPLEHPAIGTIEIFLVQTADRPGGSEFEAIFT